MKSIAVSLLAFPAFVCILPSVASTSIIEKLDIYSVLALILASTTTLLGCASWLVDKYSSSLQKLDLFGIFFALSLAAIAVPVVSSPLSDPLRDSYTFLFTICVILVAFMFATNFWLAENLFLGWRRFCALGVCYVQCYIAGVIFGAPFFSSYRSTSLWSSVLAYVILHPSQLNRLFKSYSSSPISMNPKTTVEAYAKDTPMFMILPQYIVKNSEMPMIHSYLNKNPAVNRYSEVKTTFNSISGTKKNKQIYVRPGNSNIFQNVLARLVGVDESDLVSWVAVGGAWIGGCMLPLDWPSPWLAWPVPSIMGAAIGHFVGLALAFLAFPVIRRFVIARDLKMNQPILAE
eukprot:TRINITY_DN12595_c0_g1_i1.p1 TRINITY_DN12595_c0_g1~~TRINITY_DN12595_c0_g1_i1.p1  ORF type:complete len:355 (-),score=64.48 TRINITY_DN12595_c0_g1_i1:38-1078(-)